MNLDFFSRLFSSLSPLKVRSELCSKQITPRSSCSKCLEICPTKGISFANEQLIVDQCNYCGNCVFVCPNHVFKLDEDFILNKVIKNQKLIIACPPMLKNINIANHEDILKVNCLHQLYPELIIKMICIIEELVVLIDTDFCKKCQGYDIANLHSSIKTFAPLINTNLSNKVSIITNPNDLSLSKNKTNNPKENANRREFFKTIVSNTKKAPQEVLSYTLENLDIQKSTESKTGSLEKSKPTKKKHILDLAKTVHFKPDTLLPYKHLAVIDCNFCSACTKLCPTKALTIIEEENSKKLMFQPQLCTECNICMDICFTGKIQWQGNISNEDFLSGEPKLLATGVSMECKECNDEFWYVPGDTIKTCPWCKKG
ncbi:MAG: hypothetical protein APF76_05905 [Desulfitibacter sp. BRH_c19]|nr:MAG: hypothetical protein APF76_05905 [Desulfitibacter sp. BRH_c19]